MSTSRARRRLIASPAASGSHRRLRRRAPGGLQRTGRRARHFPTRHRAARGALIVCRETIHETVCRRPKSRRKTTCEVSSRSRTACRRTIREAVNRFQMAISATTRVAGSRSRTAFRKTIREAVSRLRISDFEAIRGAGRRFPPVCPVTTREAGRRFRMACRETTPGVVLRLRMGRETSSETARCRKIRRRHDRGARTETAAPPSIARACSQSMAWRKRSSAARWSRA